jgi:hypothetical protein
MPSKVFEALTSQRTLSHHTTLPRTNAVPGMGVAPQPSPWTSWGLGTLGSLGIRIATAFAAMRTKERLKTEAGRTKAALGAR